MKSKCIVEKRNPKNHLDGCGVNFGSRRKRVVGDGDDGRHFLLVLGVLADRGENIRYCGSSSVCQR